MEFFSALSLPFLLFPLVLLSIFLLFRRILGKKPTPSPASFAQGVKNGHRFFDWMVELLEASPTNTVTAVFGVATANPSNVEHMLKTNFENYPKGERNLGILKDLLGRGIFNSDGEWWRAQRKAASVEFNTRSIRTFTTENVQEQVVGRLLPLLKRASEGGETLDLQDVLDRLAFDNVCRFALGVDPARLAGDTEDGGRFARAYEDAVDLSLARFRYPSPVIWKLMRLFKVGPERRLRESMSIINEFANKVIRSKKEVVGWTSSDLLSRFINSNGGGEYSDEFLRDTVVSFILAGKDTTSSVLSWFFWLLSSEPAVERKILDEVESVRRRHGNPSGGGGGGFTLEELRGMQYLHAALSETLRLYPPVPLNTRMCREDDVMPDGTFVRKGSPVAYNSYAMGRLESVWGGNCREFVPERWLEDGVYQHKSPFQFPVFHAGPRMCLGKEMAYAQMKAVAASVLERFEIEVVGGDKCGRHRFAAMLRMDGGLPVRVRERVVW